MLFKIVGQHNDVVWLPFLQIQYTSTADSLIAEKIRVISNEERVADDLNCFIGRFSPIDDAEGLAYFAKYKHSDCRLHARDESIFAGYLSYMIGMQVGNSRTRYVANSFTSSLFSLASFLTDSKHQYCRFTYCRKNSGYQ